MALPTYPVAPVTNTRSRAPVPPPPLFPIDAPPLILVRRAAPTPPGPERMLRRRAATTPRGRNGAVAHRRVLRSPRPRRRTSVPLCGLMVAPYKMDVGGVLLRPTGTSPPPAARRRIPPRKEGGRDGGRASPTQGALGTQRAFHLAVDHRVAGAGAVDLGHRRNGGHG